MKTILIQAIDPADRGARENEVLISRIIGWYSRDGYYDNPRWTSYKGPTTIISIDSGAEYEIAESMESFRGRISSLIDADESAINDTNAEMEWARTITEDVRQSSTPYDFMRLIKRRFAEYQREHCRKHHNSECSDR